MNTKSNTLEDYLTATPLCDCDNRWLQEKAEEMIDGANTLERKALRIFYFVRDDIRFGLAFSRSKASETLRMRSQWKN